MDSKDIWRKVLILGLRSMLRSKDFNRIYRLGRSGRLFIILKVVEVMGFIVERYFFDSVISLVFISLIRNLL